MLQSAPQSVAGDQVKSLLKVHKIAVKFLLRLLCLLHQRLIHKDLIRSPEILSEPSLHLGSAFYLLGPS